MSTDPETVVHRILADLRKLRETRQDAVAQRLRKRLEEEIRKTVEQLKTEIAAIREHDLEEN